MSNSNNISSSRSGHNYHCHHDRHHCHTFHCRCSVKKCYVIFLNNAITFPEVVFSVLVCGQQEAAVEMKFCHLIFLLYVSVLTSHTLLFS